MNETRINEAEIMLLNILKAQPGMLKEVFASQDNGKELADFVESFIRQYSENREKLLR